MHCWIRLEQATSKTERSVFIKMCKNCSPLRGSMLILNFYPCLLNIEKKYLQVFIALNQSINKKIIFFKVKFCSIASYLPFGIHNILSNIVANTQLFFIHLKEK